MYKPIFMVSMFKVHFIYSLYNRSLSSGQIKYNRLSKKFEANFLTDKERRCKYVIFRLFKLELCLTWK